MAAMSVLLLLHWVIARAAAYWPGVSRVVEGVPVLLSRDGEDDPSKQKRVAVSVTDLQEALRQNGHLGIDQTSLVVLEPSGKISILAKPD
jgi:uncharacterized membrane protein YcaP (DUF421 family)